MKLIVKIMIIFCLLSMQLGFADLIIVDINGTGDYSSIQTAIENSVPGDTVSVMPGTYVENLNYKGKNICVKSSSNEPKTTIIDGSQPADTTYGSVATFLSGEDTTAILRGFTLTGGTGMYLEDGDFKARAGGGIIIERGSSPLIENNIIRDNVADGGGGMDIASNGSNPIVRNNLIWRNIASDEDPRWTFAGGGIEISYGARPVICNNTIVNNKCFDGAGGIGAIINGMPSIYNNIIVNNIGGGISAQQIILVVASYNNVWNNTVDDVIGQVLNGNSISVDPLFVDSENGIFELQSVSPCINAGDPASPYDPDNSIADLGAFYNPLGAAVGNAENGRFPEYYKLLQNFPNPFNPSTTISYSLPRNTHVELSIYNTLGEKVQLIVDEKKTAGEHTVRFEAKELSGGIYFYKIKAGEFDQTRKMLLVK
jgi:hypothetical protein